MLFKTPKVLCLLSVCMCVCGGVRTPHPLPVCIAHLGDAGQPVCARERFLFQTVILSTLGKLDSASTQTSSPKGQSKHGPPLGFLYVPGRQTRAWPDRWAVLLQGAGAAAAPLHCGEESLHRWQRACPGEEVWPRGHGIGCDVPFFGQ